MALKYKPYAAEKVICTVAGAHRLRAFAEDSMVEITYESDFTTLSKSCTGDARHVILSDRSGTISLDLAPQSPSNAVLAQLNLAGVPFPFSLVDTSSTGDMFFAPSCMVQKMPSMVKGRENATNTWVLQFTSGKTTFGGAVEL